MLYGVKVARPLLLIETDQTFWQPLCITNIEYSTVPLFSLVHAIKSCIFVLCTSSPHLIEVRERIRINGKSISKEMFAHYFWDCWENFEVCVAS